MNASHVTYFSRARHAVSRLLRAGECQKDETVTLPDHHGGNEPVAPALCRVPAVIQIIQAAEGLDALEPACDVLASKSDMPMQDFAWIRSYALTFAGEGELHFLVVGEPPNVTAIAPLVRRLGRPDRLELLGVNELYEPMDFFGADSSALMLLARSLVRSGIPVLLKRVPANSPLIGVLRHAYRWRGMVFCRPVPGCPWIPLDASWKQPEHQLSHGRRSHLRQARRIAERMGPVTSEVLSPTMNELGPLLEEAFRVEAAGWKGRCGSAMAHDTLKGAFFRRYAAEACRTKMLRLCFLRIGGRAAAMQLAVEYRERWWLLKVGYDEAFARCSPGALMLLETVRYAAAHGLRSYEFLGTVEPWIQMWTKSVRPCLSLAAYPANAKGLAALGTDSMAMMRKVLEKR